ncbi:hypothetical protein FY528_07770 [Hymenobacter lutimineralis]|uniref:DUF4142 domain-containing protein n=1 Tax=Hymenobacter lutimineralis TaxID=2606448 RepID=A0A5D6V533_9BACT|nr:hypothetical protein [Hymenobacter lutimineralis]TYZ10943.1 hypothetical protein FY528_07770 [Hymenobacter lutimineralis]
MKKIFTFLLGFSLLSGSVLAAGPAKEHSKGLQDKECTAPAAYAKQVANRSQEVTAYFTDVLRLSHKQALAVHKVTLAKLQALQQATEQSEVSPLLADDETLLATPSIAQVLHRYDLAMLRILSAGQYNSFRLLEDRQPAADLLTLEMSAQ